MFQQILSPAANLALTWLVALVPVVLLLVLLTVFRMSAWLAALIGSIVTFLLAVWVWRMPFGDGARAYLFGSATGIWAVEWITVWGPLACPLFAPRSTPDPGWRQGAFGFHYERSDRLWHKPKVSFFDNFVTNATERLKSTA